MRFQRARSAPRALAAAVALASGAVLLGACADPEPGQFVPVSGFAGVVAGDEPRAVVVGRQVLANNGTAVDAAVAMYFTMAVTMPSRVSLGGGGVCVVFDSDGPAGEDDPVGEAIEFLPRASPSGGMVPSSMRAMAALHARYGRARWERLLSPAETLARFGHPVSRAFAMDLAAAAAHVNANPELKRVFSAQSGRLAQTGDKIYQPELSGVLSGIRRQGTPYLHSGPFARRLAEASSAVGLPLTAQDIRENVPFIREAVAVPTGGKFVAYFAPPRATGGVTSAQIWQALTNVESYDDADAGEQEHLFAEAAARAFAQRTRWMAADGSAREPLADLIDEDRLEDVMADYDPDRHTPTNRLSPVPAPVSTDAYSAGFVVGDRRSNAVACSFTMNRLFGAGRMARGTGVLLAAPPRSQNDGSTLLTAVVVGNTATGKVLFGGTAGGGPVAATTLARIMLETMEVERPITEALAAPRVHHGGAPDVLIHEPMLDQAVREALRRRGHSLRQAGALGHVNAFHCPDGLKSRRDSCQVASDPRGYGLAELVR